MAPRRPLGALGAVLLSAVLASAWVWAADVDWGLPAGRDASAPDTFVLRQLASRGLPFGPGERLRFAIEYGPIRAGTASLEVLPMLTYRGHRCYHMVSTAQSAPFFDSVYRVRDRIDTMIDAERFVTWQYRKIQNEGSYRTEHRAQYDPATARARYADGTILTTPKNAVDMLGAFYFARLMPLSGRSVFIPHHSDRKSFYLEVRVLGRERVNVPAGTFSCVVVEPLVRDSGPFQSQGRLTIWLTDDARHMPVLMKSKVPVGSINAVLQDYTLGSAPTLAQSAESGT